MNTVKLASWAHDAFRAIDPSKFPEDSSIEEKRKAIVILLQKINDLEGGLIECFDNKTNVTEIDRIDGLSHARSKKTQHVFSKMANSAEELQEALEKLQGTDREACEIMLEWFVHIGNVIPDNNQELYLDMQKRINEILHTVFSVRERLQQITNAG